MGRALGPKSVQCPSHAARSQFHYYRYLYISHICANMLVQLESAKSVAYSSVRVDESDQVELEMSTMLAKSYCSEVFNKIAGDNIQVHGGIGFTWEHPAHLYFKKAKSDSLLLSTPKIARDRIASLLSI